MLQHFVFGRLLVSNRFYHIIIIFFIFQFALFSQNSILSISPTSDSLNVQLITQEEVTKQLLLIDEYLDNAEPELALVELLDLENKGLLNDTTFFQKAKVLFWLEQTKPALMSLVAAYIRTPSLEVLQYIAIADYALGNKKRAVEKLKKLQKIDDNLTFSLATLYQQLFIHNRKEMANATQDALREIDPNAYNRYFPLPQISLLSPKNNASTMEAQSTVVFEVKHGAQIQNLSINGKTYFGMDEQDIDKEDKHFQQNFTYTLPIIAGKNKFKIEATDIFGYAATMDFTINGLNFTFLKNWNTPHSDSLNRNLQLLGSYIPEDTISIRKNSTSKAIIFSTNTNWDTSYFNSKASVFYTILTAPYTGQFDKENVKCLLSQYSKAENIDLLINNWIIPEINLQNEIFLYLGGEWDIDNGWFIRTQELGLDMKPYLLSLFNQTHKGISVIFDGVGNQRDRLQRELENALKGTFAPVEVLLPSDSDYRDSLIQNITNPSIQDSGSLPVSFSLQDYLLIDGSALFVTNNKKRIEFAHSPAKRIYTSQSEMLLELPDRLKSDRMSRRNREKIVTFCSDWHRYYELVRYMAENLSASDLLIQVEEYLERKANEENK